MIFLLGINGFIAKNFYLKLKKSKIQVCCLDHNDLDKIFAVDDNDIIINFCGSNRGKTLEDFDNANYLFVKKIVEKIGTICGTCKPYFLHISSLMVYGFNTTNVKSSEEYQQYFISSKIKGEEYLINNYPTDRLCIARPSNIYGYDCKPYYNNILVTLVYEKIIKNYKINKINKNCVRNFLSVNGLCTELEKIVNNRTTGIYNIISNNNVNLESLVNIIHQEKLPNEITINDGDVSIPNLENSNIIEGKIIIHNENLNENIKMIENQMEKYIQLCEQSETKKLEKISQQRGDMVEIANTDFKRLYMISLTDHSVRGNHYHYEQIEYFYQHQGRVIFILVHKDNLDVILLRVIEPNSIVIVKPYIIHTLINDFISNKCEVFVTSTQSFIKNEIPDTEYINVL